MLRCEEYSIELGPSYAHPFHFQTGIATLTEYSVPTSVLFSMSSRTTRGMLGRTNTQLAGDRVIFKN